MVMQPTVFFGCCSNTVSSYFVHTMYIQSNCFSDDIDIKYVFVTGFFMHIIWLNSWKLQTCLLYQVCKWQVKPHVSTLLKMRQRCIRQLDFIINQMMIEEYKTY
jgi:hypothetical protein